MVNLMVFSPHPDDAELVVGGIILKHAKKYKVVVVNVTDGGASCNGTVKERFRESQFLNEFTNIQVINLGFKDGRIEFMQEEVHKKFVEIVRKYRPSIILAPYKEDQHPDHRAVAYLCKNAVYTAGTRFGGDAFSCKNLFYYSQVVFRSEQETIYFDVSDVYETKNEIIQTYATQFDKDLKKTLVNSCLVEQIRAKDIYCGNIINSKYAEQLTTDRGICCTNLFDIAWV